MFFEQLSKACKDKNISVTNLTTILAISKSNVTHWKNGTLPNSEVVIRISNYLGVSTDFLLKGVEDNISKAIIETNNQNPTINNSQHVEINGIKNDHMLNATFYSYPNNTSFKHIEIKSNTDLANADLSETAMELVRILESLPVKARTRLMNLIYDFEEEYKNK